MKMKVETLLQILIGGIILAGLGWLLVQVFEMKGTLGSVDTKLIETSSRVERIAAVLPDLRIKIAMEEVTKPVRAAVITTEPVKTGSGTWKAAVHYLDPTAGERKTYIVTLKGPDDEAVAHIVRGIATGIAADAVSFGELLRFSSDVGKPASVPSYVRAESSFVIRKGSIEYTNKLTKTLDVSPRTSALTWKGTTWNDLSTELSSNATAYILE